jgi:magnesium-transporting ATPase (P-type)
MGGAPALVRMLNTHAERGIDSASVDARKEAFGANKFAEVPPKPFHEILLEALQDPTLIMLMVAAAIQTILGIVIPSERKEKAWSEGEFSRGVETWRTDPVAPAARTVSLRCF